MSMLIVGSGDPFDDESHVYVVYIAVSIVVAVHDLDRIHPHPRGEIGMRVVDTRVDHRHPEAGIPGRHVPGLLRRDRLQRPLLAVEQIARHPGHLHPVVRLDQSDAGRLLEGPQRAGDAAGAPLETHDEPIRGVGRSAAAAGGRLLGARPDGEREDHQEHRDETPDPPAVPVSFLRVSHVESPPSLPSREGFHDPRKLDQISGQPAGSRANPPPRRPDPGVQGDAYTSPGARPDPWDTRVESCHVAFRMLFALSTEISARW
jgi:hypothetical protein